MGNLRAMKAVDSTRATNLAAQDLEGRDVGYERPICAKSGQGVAWFVAAPSGAAVEIRSGSVTQGLAQHEQAHREPGWMMPAVRS